MAIKGSCHCGAIQFRLAQAPTSLTRCTCSFCSKRGVLWAYYEPKDFRMTSPPATDATYRWGSRLIVHHHCSTCGCGTFSDTPKWVDGQPDPVERRVAVNSRLLDDVDLEPLPVQVIDGKNLW